MPSRSRPGPYTRAGNESLRARLDSNKELFEYLGAPSDTTKRFGESFLPGARSLAWSVEDPAGGKVRYVRE